MKFISYIAGLTIGAVSVAALPDLNLPDFDLVTEYAKLLQMCNAGPLNTYAAVRYAGLNNYETFAFGECYPYRINGSLAQMAVFCKSVTCYNNPNADCTGGAVPPVPVPLEAGLTLVNIGDWVHLLGSAATCNQNGL
ncbi:hypothetical protein MVEN_01707600 [Mycena venus]|uniref:Uncharacterized protein n=1 Tax=Mycena venus TaxID=2733690 RepID=A0A8H7CQ61_9AGAR|nr:hypothetical protein MVEN_01707600 [Mycena venus]